MVSARLPSRATSPPDRCGRSPSSAERRGQTRRSSPSRRREVASDTGEASTPKPLARGPASFAKSPAIPDRETETKPQPRNCRPQGKGVRTAYRTSIASGSGSQRPKRCPQTSGQRPSSGCSLPPSSMQDRQECGHAPPSQALRGFRNTGVHTGETSPADAIEAQLRQLQNRARGRRCVEGAPHRGPPPREHLADHRDAGRQRLTTPARPCTDRRCPPSPASSRPSSRRRGHRRSARASRCSRSGPSSRLRGRRRGRLCGCDQEPR